MTPESRELAHAWLEKARNDLEAARLLIRDESRLFGIAGFHCQQAAEKGLKAWLTLREIIFPKTHSLINLVGLCKQTNPEFSRFHEHAVVLTPLASAFRYPGSASEPDSAVASRALALAEEICNFCEQQLGLKKE
jgi:HEPN domain-containing protein